MSPQIACPRCIVTLVAFRKCLPGGEESRLKIYQEIQKKSPKKCLLGRVDWCPRVSGFPDWRLCATLHGQQIYIHPYIRVKYSDFLLAPHFAVRKVLQSVQSFNITFQCDAVLPLWCFSLSEICKQFKSSVSTGYFFFNGTPLKS